MNAINRTTACRTVSVVAFFLLTCNGLQSAWAADKDSSIFSFKGFGTLAATGTDTDALEFRRDISSADGATNAWSLLTDSRLGLQIEATINDSFSATAQWTMRDRSGNFFEQNLDLAFLRWDVTPDFFVRFGRMSADVFMLSDHRNVSYAYPWMRPPHEFYASIPIYHYDGIDATKKFEIDNGYLTLRLFGGYTFDSVPLPNFLYHDEEAVVSGSALYEKGNWRARIAYSYLNVRTEPDSLAQLRAAVIDPRVSFAWPQAPSLLPYLNNIGKSAHFTELGVSYDDGTWLGQAEATYIDTGTRLYPSVASGYLSLGRRISSLTLYSLLGISKTTTSTIALSDPLIQDPRLALLKTAINTTINANDIDEKSISLGLRWDFYSNMAFKAQWSHYWLGNGGTQNWVEKSMQTPPDEVNVFSTGIDFTF